MFKDFFRPDAIEAKLSLTFHDRSLLQLAFIHRSFWNEHRDQISSHNERLEFLGDSVLGLIIAEYLYNTYPQLDEGDLSSLRAKIVDAPTCALFVQKLDVHSYLLLGKGEKMNAGKGRESILADLLEALIGALFLDQGIEVAKKFYLSHFKEHIDKMVATPPRNWKAELQDYAQKKYQQTPLYEVLEESGPSHQKKFRVSVKIRDVKVGEGEGLSKKEAQTQAAQSALLKLQERI